MTSSTPRNAKNGLEALPGRAAKRRLGWAVGIVWMAWVGGSSSLAQTSPERFEYSQRHMGVQVRLVLYAPNEPAAVEAARAAFARIAELEDIMSDYRPASELMRLSARFSDAPGGPPVPVSADLFSVLAQAQHLAEVSDGAFDVTVGPYVKVWRQARKDRRLPPPAVREAAAERVGWTSVRLDSARQTVQLLAPSMQLDLGGIAKGYAADEALEVLQNHGIDRALVEIGGDVAVSGPPPGQAGWRIRIENAEAGRPADTTLAHAAISSSGDTEQFVEIDGTRYSHVVDPRTGLGLTDRIAVTVVAPSATLSDGLATLLGVLGPERGAAVVEAHWPDVRFSIRRVEGGVGGRGEEGKRGRGKDDGWCAAEDHAVGSGR